MIERFEQSRNRPRIDFRLVSGILGGLIFALGAALLLPFLIALIYSEASWGAFLITATGSMAGGAFFLLVLLSK